MKIKQQKSYLMTTKNLKKTKKMNITEEQIRKIASQELDIKKVFPEVFNFTGWAKCKNHKEWLGYFENNILQYGFSTSGNWFNTDNGAQYNPNIERPATHEEIKTALVNEAKKRGFEFDSYHYRNSNNTLHGIKGDVNVSDFIFIFENGTWAEVKKEPKYVLMNEGLYVNLVQVYRQEVYISSDSNKELAIIFDTKEKAEAMNVLLDNKYKLEEL